MAQVLKISARRQRRARTLGRPRANKETDMEVIL
jgi:hypothetical protein